jgi:hypothetical protein
MMAKFTLEVSYDCGGSYGIDSSYDGLDDPTLKARTDRLDAEGLRWAIEDANGEIVDVGRIQKGIIEMLRGLRPPP